MMMSSWHVWGLNSLFCLVLISCSGGSEFNNNDDYGLDLKSCSANVQKEFVHRAMQDRYYWYDEIVDNLDYDAFSSPSAVVKYLRKQPQDRFSYVTTSVSQESFYDQGQYVGFGFSFEFDVDERVFIRFVYTDSPAGKAGLQRGDEIIAVDGLAISSYIAHDSEGEPYLESAFGGATLGIQKALKIQRQDATQTTLNLVKSVVTINTVLAAKTIDFNNKKYAYLAFKNFINPSYDELASAFAGFKSSGAEKLILDLRYNGGGLIAVASTLGSYVYKPQVDNVDIFTQLKFNAKYNGEDYNFYFNEISNTLDLQGVIVLTTEASCSASEMVINALEPFIDVTVVGSTTCGKPIGMRSQSFCGNELVAINFQGFNANNFGDYFDGLNADCAASDDVSVALGHINEPMLKAALDFDNDGSCVASRSAMPSVKIPNYQGLQSIYESE